MSVADQPMLSSGIIIAAGLVWLGLLFGVALYGERHPRVLKNRWAIVYALSLAIHCTSWTFYGTVTQASRSGWWLPPTFVGAILLYAFGAAVLMRLVRLARDYNAGSLADLIAARLGRHSGLAALVTAVMLVGIVPYIALQLKAVAMSYGVLSRDHYDGMPAWQDSALYVALLMALFAMLFGTRRAAATEHNRGLVLAMAFESLFKLGAMLALGAMLLIPMHGLPSVLPAPAPMPVPVAHDTQGFPALILLGALAMFTLPHQFHVGVVECRDARHVRTARWLFPLYLLLIAAPILPLARLGDAWLGPAGVSSDLYVLALPLAQQQNGLALLAFLGGLSAATSMVVVATLALSLMVANHFVAPLLVHAGWGRGEQGDLRRAVLTQRRLAILAIVLLAWGYSRVLVGNDALADIGAISFSALAELAPATLVAIYRPQLGARAVGVGLLLGTLVWLYALLPALFAAQPVWVHEGPFGIAWLAPQQLLGLSGWSGLGRAVVLSLLVNVAAIALVARSRFGRVQPVSSGGGVPLHELRALSMRFLPMLQVEALFHDAPERVLSEPQRVAAVEHELAAVIGAASARLLLDVMRHQGREDLDTVAAIVGETAQDLRFNQRVLSAALANMSQGICVVDAELCVVAWNQPYADLFAYPDGLLEVGCPVLQLMRYNVAAGMIGTGDVEARCQRRLAYMRAGTPHLSERHLADDRAIEIRGNPMPGGGYVATFTDVTDFRNAERGLKRSNETLELRVAERTHALAQASEAAQRANEAKTHFLAAVSHDLLQPLHAAQLFAHTLEERLGDSHSETAQHLHGALDATEHLLAGLLDIARLEGGRLLARPRAFALADVLDPLAAEFGVLAAERSIRLSVVGTDVWVHSDPQLLRRVLQNFLANALRYTRRGRVLLGCRRRDGALDLEVWDTGPGIDIAEQALIFQEFRRGSVASGQGLGLGLAIAERMAGLLGHRLTLRSWPGRGSVFGVRFAQVSAAGTDKPAAVVMPTPLPHGRVLVVDNEPDALAAMLSLFVNWHWSAHGAATLEKALAVPWPPDVLVLDYHLDGGVTGLDVLEALRLRFAAVPAIVLTADHDPGLRQQVLAADAIMLYKPLKPLTLRQVLQRIVVAASQALPTQRS